MKFKYGGFVHCWAYFWKMLEGERLPAESSLCTLFWRCAFNAIPAALFCVIMPVALCVFAICWRIVSNIGAFLFAARAEAWNGFFSPPDETDFEKYESWPSVMGYRILPIYFVLAGLMAWGVYAFHAMSFLLGLLVGPIAGLLVFLIALGIKKLLKTEPGMMVTGFIAAKKQGICPIVKFVKEEKPAAEQ